MKKIIPVFILAVSLSTTAQATVYEGLIKELWINGSSVPDIGWINTQGSMQNPVCGDDRWIAVDLTNESMRMAMSFALAAHMAGKTIKLEGSGQCLASTDYEYLKYIVIK